ncbi:unnamed protein product [Anisakis simplex]|uniref:Carboxypeptidase n=1 Tax=Anisakis simplex TaxID=6269 RepID=A0A0M3KJN9_ANISI|nr:unnamed protein product [Anisakis simplex]
MFQSACASQTASGNVDALEAFYERFPEYKNRPFYVGGESYGGVYVPVTSAEVVKRIKVCSVVEILSVDDILLKMEYLHSQSRTQIHLSVKE